MDGEQTLYLGTGPVDGIEQLIGSPVLRVHGHFGASGEATHSVPVARYGLRRERHLSADTKGLEDSRNPMNEINRRHRYFKMFMSRHGSYGRASIQDRCNLFGFAYNRRGEVEIMVEDFLGLALKSKKVMRYRTVMGSKTDKK